MTARLIVTGRLLQFSGDLVLFGSSLFYLYGFAAGGPDWFSCTRCWPKLILSGATLAAGAGIVIWVMAQTASISDQPSDAFNPAVVLSVLTETRFGRICLLRLGLLTACVILLGWLSPGRKLWLSMAVLSGVLVATFAWLGHGIKDDGLAGVVHLTGDLLHLFAAGVWLGALVPLSVLIMQSLRTEHVSDAHATYHALESFSAIGASVVAVLLFSGIINSWFLIGWNQMAALVTTTYGLALSLKLILFGAMLLLAANNRFHLSPRLAHGIDRQGSTDALRALRFSLLTETGLALLVLTAVAFLGTLEPPVSS